MQINITDLLLKEITISKYNDKFSVGVLYSLIDDTGSEIQDKRDLITDEQLTSDNKINITNLLTLSHDTIKTREGI